MTDVPSNATQRHYERGLGARIQRRGGDAHNARVTAKPLERLRHAKGTWREIMTSNTGLPIAFIFSYDFCSPTGSEAIITKKCIRDEKSNEITLEIVINKFISTLPPIPNADTPRGEWARNSRMCNADSGHEWQRLTRAERANLQSCNLIDHIG
ncbi:hypothetical protein EVAR_36867_1 [Eumeta japonica]|uniref:Uncharacterized protein n=1 Tax=Eumeta variegata TaxID=151549 RepID=A0A4C1WVB0_EUMVA|nr:hypothetical protein EVAR_36867_1 [Eumeta japonica]